MQDLSATDSGPISVNSQESDGLIYYSSDVPTPSLHLATGNPNIITDWPVIDK